MRLLLILLLAVSAHAEFLDLRIAFQGTDCISCAESLEGRLARVRGIEKVDLDLAASTVHLILAPSNKVRLGPLEARITQDGTKILSIEAVCRGQTVQTADGLALHPSGLTQPLPLVSDDPPVAGAVGVATGRIEDGRFLLENWQADSGTQ